MASESGIKKFFDNKQLIHIASEVVVLVGLTFYFSAKNRKLLGHIEELAQRLEEQEDRVQKMENMLQQVGTSLNNLPLKDFAQKIEGHEKRMMGIENLVSTLSYQKPVRNKRQVNKQQVKRVHKPIEQHARSSYEHERKPVNVYQQPVEHERKPVNVYEPPVEHERKPVHLEPIYEEPEPVQPPRTTNKIQFDDDVEYYEVSDEEESGNDSDLDEEIRTELEELEEQPSLKTEQ